MQEGGLINRWVYYLKSQNFFDESPSDTSTHQRCSIKVFLKKERLSGISGVIEREHWAKMGKARFRFAKSCGILLSNTSGIYIQILYAQTYIFHKPNLKVTGKVFCVTTIKIA